MNGWEDREYKSGLEKVEDREWALLILGKRKSSMALLLWA
jgi:hypothetical protein